MIIPRQKIKVFISSICGEEKYDNLRAKLKKLIEETNIADVYLFEATGASTLTSQQHYVWDLENSDICIFIIDNADGIKSGVQKEIDTAKKHHKKSFYYFCDENSKEPTAIQRGLIGPDSPKYKVVHSFDELLDGAQSLIDDIVAIYKYYCDGRLEAKSETSREVEVNEDMCDSSLIVEKTIIANTDRCKLYFHKMFSKFEKEEKGSSEFDAWCAQFLPVLFEHASIRTFNTSMFLEELKKHQTNEHFMAVEKRWTAIQHYFNGDLDKCIESLKEALTIAKSNNLSEWFIKDILIDLRNKNYELFESKNTICLNDSAQSELNNSSHALYYPLIDRMQGDLYEKFTEEYFKEKIKSPHTVSLGYNITQTDSISNCFVVSMFNGSLTYLLLLHKQIRELSFWLSTKFINWEFRKNLVREAVFETSQKEIDTLYRAFPEILVKLNHADALEIYDYSNNHPISYKRLITKFHALGMVGYYLSDESFETISKELIAEINVWMNLENPILSIGDSCLKCLQNIGHRISSKTLSEICCKFMQKEFSRFYPEVFRLISSKIDISTLPRESAINLIDHVASLLKDEKSKLPYIEKVLISFRKQSIELTEGLDVMIREKLPVFYSNLYKLETSSNQEDNVHFVKEYIQQIRTHNQEQGKGGVYRGYSSLPHDTIRNIMMIKESTYDDNVVDDAFSASCETLLCDNQSIKTKCEAMDLIMFLIRRYPQVSYRNKTNVERIKTNFDIIQGCSNVISDSNISNVSLLFSYHLLMTSFDESSCFKLFEVLPCAQDEIPDQLRICETILYFLENDESSAINVQLESILLQTILTWINADSVDLRWYCVRILFLLARNPKLSDVISYQLISLIDNDNAYIKNLIQRFVVESCVDDSTKDYIATKCANDGNYVVRKVYQELHQT